MQWVRVGRYLNSQEAELARARLARDGIPSQVSGATANAMGGPFGGAVYCVELEVPQLDVPLATDILRNIESRRAARLHTKPPCPKCGNATPVQTMVRARVVGGCMIFAAIVDSVVLHEPWSSLALFAVGLYLVISPGNIRWVCPSCATVWHTAYFWNEQQLAEQDEEEEPEDDDQGHRGADPPEHSVEIR